MFHTPSNRPATKSPTHSARDSGVWELGLKRSAAASGEIDPQLFARASGAARAFAEECLPDSVSQELFEKVATPLTLLFVCGDLPAEQTLELREQLDDIFAGRSCDLGSWAGQTLAAWWRSLATHEQLPARLAELMQEDFAAVLATTARDSGEWDLAEWEQLRVPAIGLRSFIELARVLLQIPMPASLSSAQLERVLELAAFAARMLNDAGSLPRDLAALREDAPVADPNWILLQAATGRGPELSRCELEGLEPELEHCRQVHNAAVAELGQLLEGDASGSFCELVCRIQDGHDDATRRIAARYAGAESRLEGFARVGARLPAA